MKLSFRTSIYLIKHKANKLGAAPLWVRIKYNGKESQFSTGIIILPKHWDPLKCKVVKHESSVTLNIELQNCIHRLKSIYHELVEKNKEVTTDIIKNFYLNKQVNEKGIISFYNLVIAKHEAREGKSIAAGTLKHYISSRGKLEMYIKEELLKDDIAIRFIDFSFLNNYETYLITRIKNMTNTISNDMKRLKVVLKEAINMGIITETPFRMYKIKSEETERETLSSQEVTLINDSFCMEDYSPKAIVKDWLLFMVYTGLAYSDLQKLSSKDIISTMNGSKVLSIKRQKTKQAATIPLFIHAERIIEKYKSFPETVASGKLLPNRSNQYINRTLKDIMKDFEISKLITCHCARHTHACIAKDLGVPIESISKTLGHSKISMTQHYTKISTNRIQLDYMAMGDFLNKSDIKSKIS